MTCWEIFTCGKIPYPGVDPSELPKFLARGRRLEKPENAACSDTMLAHTHSHTHIHTHTLHLELCHFRYSLMLKCWDSDPEDRPSFTKIGSTISTALHTMEGYPDVSAADTSNIHVPPTHDKIRQPVQVKRSLWYFHFRHWVVPSLCCALIG